MVDNGDELLKMDSNMPNLFGAATKLIEENNQNRILSQHPANLTEGNQHIYAFRKKFGIKPKNTAN
jgi:hypothetical protein